jgi:hypothetical protein
MSAFAEWKEIVGFVRLKKLTRCAGWKSKEGMRSARFGSVSETAAIRTATMVTAETTEDGKWQ